jgi:hypothetical protein
MKSLPDLPVFRLQPLSGLGLHLGIEPNLPSALLSLDLHQLSERPRMGKMFKELGFF